MQSISLNTPLHIGAVRAANRIALNSGHPAFRADARGVPNGEGPAFAPASLVLASSATVNLTGYARSGMPGLYDPTQQKAWQALIQRVHQQGCLLALPLTHAGRVSHRSLQPNGVAPIAPTAGQAASFTSIENSQGHILRTLCSEARTMLLAEIADLPNDFRRAAAMALEAGADLVEIDAAQGYLLHQFLSAESNQRQDMYGGSVENRVRLVLEVMDAVLQVCPAARLGLALSPVGVFRGLESIDMSDAILQLAAAAQARGLAYLRLVEPEWRYGHQVPDALRTGLRKVFGGALLASGSYDQDKAGDLLARELLDMAAFHCSQMPQTLTTQVLQVA
ncbi:MULTISPECIES: alkene reductase [unclassified Paludibacterium]|uniref:oxidoreductase n=1 Tax=unclassified Paludibacterium TaxID=2618429 RepID=UPI001C040669|nr:alkene reductase [Paludibacterium sp. B53371]BEV71968.1 alkene reductase [Paludibacterium sp. THUN1379]